MLVYSITSRSSFEEAGVMHDWITRIRDQEMPVVSVILAGQAVCVCVCVCCGETTALGSPSPIFSSFLFT